MHTTTSTEESSNGRACEQSAQLEAHAWGQPCLPGQLPGLFKLVNNNVHAGHPAAVLAGKLHGDRAETASGVQDMVFAADPGWFRNHIGQPPKAGCPELRNRGERHAEFVGRLSRLEELNVKSADSPVEFLPFGVVPDDRCLVP